MIAAEVFAAVPDSAPLVFFVLLAAAYYAAVSIYTHRWR